MENEKEEYIIMKEEEFQLIIKRIDTLIKQISDGNSTEFPINHE